VPDLKSTVPDLGVKVPDPKLEVPDLRSGGIRLNLSLLLNDQWIKTVELDNDHKSSSECVV